MLQCAQSLRFCEPRISNRELKDEASCWSSVHSGVDCISNRELKDKAVCFRKYRWVEWGISNRELKEKQEKEVKVRGRICASQIEN